MSVWSNNSLLEDFLIQKQLDDLDFVKTTKDSQLEYTCLFLDLDQNISNLTEKVLDFHLKSQNTQKKIATILISKVYGSEEKINYFRKLFVDISQKEPFHRLIICQDIYFLDPSGPITPFDNYLHNIIQKNEVAVSTKGDFFFYPLSLNELLLTIKKSLYLSNTGGKTFYVQGEKTSDLNLAYLLKNSLEEHLAQTLDINNSQNSHQSKIDYHSDTLKTSALLNTETKNDFSQDLNLFLKKYQKEETFIIGVKKTFFNKLTHKIREIKIFQGERSVKDTLLQKTKQLIEKVLAVVGLVYLTSSLLFIFSSYYSLKNLEKSLFYMKNGNISQSSKYLSYSSVFKKISETNYQLVAPVIVFFAPSIDTANINFLNFLGFTQNSFQSLQQTFNLAETVYLSINSSQNKQDYEKTSLALKSNLQQNFESINQIEIILNKDNLPRPLLEKIKQNIEYKQLKTNQNQIGELIKVVDIIPSLLGNNKTSNIFILLQNDHEQRATGGLIEHLYQISFDRGQLVYQKAFLPSEIDKIDSLTLIPPPLIEKLTGETTWNLKDMNYNPDFPQTATNIAWYLEKKLKIKPDLIISLNTSVLENLLQNYPHLFPETFQAGSEDNKNHLDIFKTLVQGTLNHQIPFLDLGKISATTFIDGNINIWSSDNNLEKNILNQPFSGSIRSYDCHSAMSAARVCLSQTSHLNFSNFSLIPLNDYLQKTINHVINLSVLSIEHSLNINYVYKKPAPFLNRNLTEIVQLYLPKTSVINEILLNGEAISLSNIFVQEEATLTRYQFIVSTTLNKNQNLQIKYTSPLLERVVLPTAYSFTDLKQSSSSNLNSTLEINLPEQARASAITSEVVSQPNKIIFKQTQKISTFGLNLVPK